METTKLFQNNFLFTFLFLTFSSNSISPNAASSPTSSLSFIFLAQLIIIRDICMPLLFLLCVSVVNNNNILINNIINASRMHLSYGHASPVLPRILVIVIVIELNVLDSIPILYPMSMLLLCTI